MANEVIELPARGESSSNMPVTRDDVEALKRQRELLKDFIGSQLREGIDNDYAIIPGTKKQSLLKPGAEKLARLFGLGIRVGMADKEIDRHANFAMFTYKAEIYLLKNPSVVIAECEASCNSQEKKYKERTVYVKGAAVKEETPIFDILNTLQKMCQKRAIVGAVILAVGGSDFFTHDIDDEEDAAQVGARGRAEPTKASVVIPKATSASSQDQSQGALPQCCGRQMMVSKYNSSELYCTVCKSKRDAVQAPPVAPKSAPIVLPKEQDGFDESPTSLFGSAPAAEEKLEQIQTDLGSLMNELQYAPPIVARHVLEMFRTSPQKMTRDQMKQLRSRYRDELARSQVK